jgi:replication factor C subunit 2/4
MNNTIPFIEKYRPKHFDDLILSPSINLKLDNILKSKTLPNIIITGSPGTGKTSTILCLARQIFKNDKSLILELNASNNRTLEFINTTVTNFCRKKIISVDTVLEDSVLENSVSKKIIIFDEADNITKKAQNLLANLMEEHSDNTIFAFTCNESSKIAESIQSRCMILRYLPMTTEHLRIKLEKICQKENIKYDIKGLNIIISISQGDIRQAINNLETTYYGYVEITEENVLKLCYHPHPKIILSIIQECVNMNFYKTIENIDDLKKSGYCANDILLTLLNTLRDINIDEDIRIAFIKVISESYMVISEGVDTNLQLYACMGRMIKYIYDTNIK